MKRKTSHKNKLQIYGISPKNPTPNFILPHRRKATTPLPYRPPNVFSGKQSYRPHICATPEHPISNSIFILMDFFGSFQMKKQSKITLLTLETDFFRSFQEFFSRSRVSINRCKLDDGLSGHINFFPRSHAMMRFFTRCAA